MEVSFKLYAPVALPSGDTAAGINFVRDCEGSRYGLMLWSKEKFFAVAGNRTLAAQHVAHRYTDQN
jgi:hypothetical protein